MDFRSSARRGDFVPGAPVLASGSAKLRQSALHASSSSCKRYSRGNGEEAECDVDPSAFDSTVAPRYYGTLVHELLAVALDFAKLRTGRYSVRLGPQGSPTALSVSQQQFFQAADEEAAAALGCVTAAVGEGLFEDSALQVLAHMQGGVFAHRAHSFFLMGAWFKALLAAAVWCIECQRDVPLEVSK